MEKQSNKGTQDERIAHGAKEWRPLDKQAIADKSDRDKQRAEYRARQNLRKLIDDAEVHS